MKTDNLNAPGEFGHAKTRGHVGARAGSAGITFTDDAGTEVDEVTDVTLRGIRLSDLDDLGIALTAELGLASLVPMTPTQLTANTDDWAPVDATDTTIDLTVATIVRASTDASRNLTGIVASIAERLVILENVGAFDLVLKHDATSTTENRFYCPNDTDVTLQKDSAVVIVYDATSARWRVVGRQSSGISGFTTPAIILGTAAAAGAASTAIRSDSTIVAFDTTAPANLGTVASAGSATVAARRDHVHRATGSGGDSGALWDQAITKASDDTVTNSSTLTNDSELAWAVLNGETWRFEAAIVYVTDATGDYKCDFAASGGTFTAVYRYIGTDTTTNALLLSTGIKDNGVSSTTDISAGGGSLSIARSILIEGIIVAGANATISFRSAQNTQTSGQSAVTKAGSRLLLRKLA